MHLSSLPIIFILLSIHALANPAPEPAVSTVTVSTPPAPTSTSYTSDPVFRDDMLAAHNFYRSEHNASALTWNSTSAKYAANWAFQCRFSHTGGPTGENLAAGYANATAAVDGWGSERKSYNFKKPTGFSEKTGHFTQVVWRNTTSVGCGRAACNGKNDTPGFYVVCEYYPPGNVEGDKNQYFKDNVQAQAKGKSTDTVESGVTGAAGSLKLGNDGSIFWITGFPLLWLLYELSQTWCL